MTDAAQSDIEESLTCQCGCGLTVHSCNHLQCPSGVPLKQEIAQQIALGKTRAEVISYFAGKYGEKILSSPTATGFNLVAWVTPFAALAIAATVIVVVSRRWRRRAVSAPAGAAPDPRDAERRARLEQELERFDA